MSRRKVEAYAVVAEGQPWPTREEARQHAARSLSGKWEVVKVTEHNPRAAALIKAALKAADSKLRVSWGVRELDALTDAVAAYRKGGK